MTEDNRPANSGDDPASPAGGHPSTNQASTAPFPGEVTGQQPSSRETTSEVEPVRDHASDAEWFAGTAEPAAPVSGEAGQPPVAGSGEAAASGDWASQAPVSGSGREAPSAGGPSGAWFAAQAQGVPQGTGPAQPEWQQPHSEWARPAEPAGERVVYGSAAPQPPSGGGAMPPPGYLIRPSQPQPQRMPEPQPQRKGGGALVVGVAIIALLVGGGAGALGGYLVADNTSSSAANALDQPVPSADQTSNAPAGSVEAVAEKVSPSVVQLRVEGSRTAGEGSGFIISADGLIVTNNHVVEVAADGGKITAVFSDGSQVPATIVGRDPTSDVAVVKADGKTGLPIVDLGNSDALKVGQGVVAIGSPFELSGTVTSGIVSSLHRPTRAGGEDGSQATVMDAIQTDAAINPGNSGGPLVNMQGQVIGINSAIYSPQQGGGGGSQAGSVGIGFAIPIDQARRTADEIVKTGKATQTVLGVSVRDNQDGGALIVDVTGGGPGAQAGLKSGDVVTKLDDRRIESSDALVAAVRSHKPGDKVRLELSNGSRTVEATLAGQTVEPQ
jgi:putative serine protease PepD